ncbi:hypothetical protein ECG_04861 [Echinococcus granulosus]|uniref:Expressed conserved protein n=1 Tax=Echinococcus granulosus TaxID=6210 RepID=U6J321_ECHGR|nr:hypothetical protein EGR_02048 [Echinococcus granulosus]EUB62954.1 hypothetical protein EGR_02048 [Echinococcus granulosus]KAH9283144.1 hypothetical protein ECG_04861 [Echinococcus granulosus]CDS16819.1 expressed conserved protein [Echinococcus granulosus]
MSSPLPSSFDLKITVKLTKRVPINPREDLLNRNLGDIYHQCLQILAGKNYDEKRISSKVNSTKDGLVLAKGSWWVYGPPVQLLAYKNILQFSSCPGRPAKVLMLITNEDRTKTELVVVKTKGPGYANHLLSVLRKNVIVAHQHLAQNTNSAVSSGSRPVSYQKEVSGTYPSTRKLSTNHSSIPQQKRRPAPNPPTAKVQEPQQLEKVISPKVPEDLPETRIRPERVKRTKVQSAKLDSESSTLTNGNYRSNYSKTTYDPETKVETLDSVVCYGQEAEKVAKSKNSNAKPRKPKNRAPRELSTLSGGRKVTREFDENNTPWEVNICYIKHDPLVGCVEDESGPIYMYTAHQLVPRDDYDNYCSDDSEENSFSDEDSDDSTSSDSEDSQDQNRELERFMMLSGSNNADHATNGTGGKLSEVYEY